MGAGVSPTSRLFRSLVGLAAGLGVMVWSSHLDTPLVDVQSSLLSAALVLVALLGGVRLGMVTAGLYVALVLLGRLPWEGLDPGALDLTPDKQLGYLVGLVPGALLAGALSRRNGWLRLWLAGIVGHLGIFAVGVPVLGQYVGNESALMAGLVPYIGAVIVKSLFAATLVAIFRPPVDDP